MITEWRDVVGYEGLYQVSNFGEVRSLPRNGTVNYVKIKAQMTDKDGYKVVKLRKNNVPKMKKVHRLVADAFIPLVVGKNIVDHINGVRNDNHVTNLRWVTTRENVMLGKTSETVLRVIQFHKGVVINKFTSLNEAKRETGISVYKIKANSVKDFHFVLESSTTRA